MVCLNFNTKECLVPTFKRSRYCSKCGNKSGKQGIVSCNKLLRDFGALKVVGKRAGQTGKAACSTSYIHDTSSTTRKVRLRCDIPASATAGSPPIVYIIPMPKKPTSSDG
jgi:hypothetical protein